VLLNPFATVLVAPEDFLNVPEFVMVRVPTPNAFVKLALLWMSQTPAFSIVADWLAGMATSELIVAVEPEGFSRIRPPLRITAFVLMVRPPLVLVRPAPVMVPVQVVGPLMVNWSVPPRVPERERLPEVAGAPVLRFSVAEVTAVAPAGE
jgi:hypothetical protein